MIAWSVRRALTKAHAEDFSHAIKSFHDELAAETNKPISLKIVFYESAQPKTVPPDARTPPGPWLEHHQDAREFHTALSLASNLQKNWKRASYIRAEYSVDSDSTVKATLEAKGWDKKSLLFAVKGLTHEVPFMQRYLGKNFIFWGKSLDSHRTLK